jgi:hypothetical protein
MRLTQLDTSLYFRFDAMASLFSDTQTMPDSWPVLDAADLPLPGQRIEDHWRDPQRIKRPEPVSPRAVRPMPRMVLSPLGRYWYEGLPERVRPHLTAERHPHVINHLALVWDVPVQRRDTLRDLLLADRHDRQGFSFEVLDELARLQAHAMG